MSNSRHAKILIIGSGAAGYTAAIYAARANLEPVVIRGLQPGGQLTITTEVENFPGFPDPIQGPELMERMGQQAANVGATIVDDIVSEVRLSERPFAIRCDSGDEYTADTVVICTGASARWLGMESEKRYMGFGVSACATCDGFFYRGKEVAVVGGGSTAVTEALYLANLASKVTVVHRRDELRAEKALQERLLAHPNVVVAWDSVVDEVLGGGTPPGVTGVRLKNVKTGALSDVPVDGVFIAIGHTPNTELFTAPGRDGRRGLYRHRAGVGFDQYSGRFRGGRRSGPYLSTGRDRRRHRVHGGARGGAIPCRARDLNRKAIDGMAQGREYRPTMHPRGLGAAPGMGGTGGVLDWDKLRIFLAVAEAGSFTHAGETLNLSQSAVSRQISVLEESLNVSLFHRHARGLILTEQGELLHRTVREMFAKLAMTEARIRESRERPSGVLRVTTTVAFGSLWADPAPERVPAPLSGYRSVGGAGRHRVGFVDARGRRGHPPFGAAPAGPDQAPPDGRAPARLCLGYLHQGIRGSGIAGGTRPSPDRRLWRGRRAAGADDQSELVARGRAAAGGIAGVRTCGSTAPTAFFAPCRPESASPRCPTT